jgi:hypothetical protein
LYGWTAEDAIGQRAHELLRSVFPAPIAELLRSGRWDGELQKSRSDGTQVIVASRWSLRRDEQGRPVAILDDLQWLDAATLDLLGDLLTRPDVQHLMLICAFRDNEVDAAHPLMRKLEAIRKAGARAGNHSRAARPRRFGTANCGFSMLQSGTRRPTGATRAREDCR